MDFETFQSEALQTWNTEEPQIANAALGLCGEYGEWEQHALTEKSNHKDELGDLLYYYAVYLHLADIDKPDLVSMLGSDVKGGHFTSDAPIRVWCAISSICEATKKFVFHDQTLDVEKSIHELELWIYNEVYSLDFDRERLRTQNIEKLRGRHGQSFDSSYHGGN